MQVLVIWLLVFLGTKHKPNMSIVNSTLQVLPVGSGDPGTYYVTMQPTTNGRTSADYAGLNLTYSPLTGNLFSSTLTTNNLNSSQLTLIGNSIVSSSTVNFSGNISIGNFANFANISTPSFVPSSGITQYATSVAGYALPSFVNSTNSAVPLQPSWANKRVNIIYAPNNAVAFQFVGGNSTNLVYAGQDRKSVV